MQGTTLPNTQASWTSTTGWWKLVPRVIIMCGFMVLLGLDLLGPTWVGLAVGLIVGALLTVLIVVYATRKGNSRMSKLAPDRITIESDRVLAHFDSHPGPGGSPLACVPFGAITEIRLKEKTGLVITTWGKSSAKVIWDNPPQVPNPSGGTLPAAAVLVLTKENGQELSTRWNAWKFPAAPPVAPPRFSGAATPRVGGTPAPTRPLATSNVAPVTYTAACPSCGGPLEFIPQYNRNYCRPCGQYA